MSYKLESEAIISRIVFGMVYGQLYEGFQKIPYIVVPISHH
jgi:hypothetical protein